ncbi:MAG: folylpolyglutamate synthase/dihydrofolate synthase family protein [Pseudomonadota bacterium]
MAERSLGAWLQHLERIHPSEIDLGLRRITIVAQRLALVPFPRHSITVAGTNGKGSVVYSIEAVARAHGKRTGRYTSPHLMSFNERIAVNGQPVDDHVIVEAFEAIEEARGDITLTYFEFATLGALFVFATQQVDLAVLEVGLGGRLDAVNIVDSDVAVVTAIDLDHQHWLGDSVDLIAPEKAAVARAGRPVVLAERDYPESLFETLRVITATVLRAGDRWAWEETDAQLSVTLASGLRGKVPVPTGLRPANVAAALQALDAHHQMELDVDLAAEALSRLTVPARRQRLTIGGREVWLDVAHNPAAMNVLVDSLANTPVAGKTVAAFGVMADKDVSAMIEKLAEVADGACALEIVGIERAARAEDLWQHLESHGIATPQSDFSMDAVWRQLWQGTQPGDRLVICGSFHSVAGIMQVISDQPPAEHQPA